MVFLEQHDDGYMSSFIPSPVADPAQWVVDSLWRSYHKLGHLGAAVTSMVPSGFEVYVRVLHPFIGPFDGTDRPDLAGGELAARFGCEFRPLAPIDQLIEGMDEKILEKFDVILPDPGAIPTRVAQGVADVLGRHTGTPEQCYFAIWEGYGGLRPSQGFGAPFEIPARRMLLYSAPIAAATEQFDSDSLVSAYHPNLWWPADHSWCVATDIDYRCTYIGCDRATAQQLLSRSDIEVFEVQPTDTPWA